MDGFLRAYQSSKAVGPPLAEAHTSTLEVSVTNIVFNHAAGSLTGDAIELRKDYATTLPRPEYTRGGESYAAYVGGTTPVTVQVRFEVVSPDPVDSVTVHAFSDDGPDGGTLSKTDQKVVSFMNGASQEGTDDPTTSWDDSEYVTFTLANPIPSQISRSDERWIWQVDELNEIPVDHLFSADASGPHHTYVLYAAPEVPWTQTVDDYHNPWTDALDLACAWGQGMPASEDVSLEEERQIVQAVAEGSYAGLSNRTYSFAASLLYGGGSPTIDLTILLTLDQIECFGAAALTQLFSQALGVNTSHVSRYRIHSFGAKFLTSELMLVGDNRWGTQRWSTHVFGWFGQGDPDDLLTWRAFDGLFVIDRDAPHFLLNRDSATYESELVQWKPEGDFAWGQWNDDVEDFQ